MRRRLPIGINVAGQSVRITNLRGWVLIGLVAVGVYYLLGAVAVFAWILGAAAGLSAATPWEADADEPRVEPMPHDRPTGGAGAPVPTWWTRPGLHDDRLRFQRLCILADCCPPARLRPVYS